ncbi:MAG: hypothetical protein Q4D99_03675 [Bacillota bacterium]|nr:hypothetical protein [Bacillota bacterium]
MNKQLLDPDAVRKSISLALEQDFDIDAAIKRVNGFLANLPAQQIFVRKNRGSYVFYQSIDGNMQYMPKTTPLLYKLCRRQYLEYVLDVLELKNELKSCTNNSSRKINTVYRDLDNAKSQINLFIEKCARGNLDIARIVLSGKQYRWYSGRFIKKAINKGNAYTTGNDIAMRSKSERDIGNIYESLAVPYHYEEHLSLFVHPLIIKFEEMLRSNNQLSNYLYYRKDNRCIWKVPAEYEWMNSAGSIWKTYQPNSGKISMFNDFRIMLADSSFIIHEHEGMADEFKYRCNASERVFILEMSKEIERNNIFYTFEDEVSNREHFRDMVVKKILPRLWF